MQKQMQTCGYPPPPTRICIRSITECRIRSSLSKFDGRTALHIYTHIADNSRIAYYIELVNNVPCVVTYINGKCVEVREILP
jgi:hypothetical protein